jgi:hypothetical protein
MMTEESKPASTFWPKFISYVLTGALGFVLGMWLICSLKKPEPVPASVIDAIIHVAFLRYPPQEPADIVLPLKGDSTYNGQLLETHKLDTIPDTLHVYTGIAKVRLTPSQAWVWYYDSLNYYTASKLTAPLDFNWDVTFGLDPTGKPHIAYTKLPQYTPRSKRTVLAVELEGGARYGVKDTTWKLAPVAGAYAVWSPWSWLNVKAGFSWPPSADVSASVIIPVVKK